MSLTNNQLQTLKTAINAETDPTFVSYRNSGATGAMAEWYNVEKSPAQKAWITLQPAADSDDAPDYSTFDALAAGKRDSWALFLNFDRNFARNKVRKWVTDVWGAATAASNAEAILQAAVRNALRGELVFGGTLKTTGTVAATDLNYIGTISNEDVVAAINLP
jgi:hypothetical protein